MKNKLSVIGLIIIAGLVYFIVMDKELVIETNVATSTATSSNSNGNVNNTNTTNTGNTSNDDAATGGIVELNVNGTIAKVDSSQIAVDGPTIITVNIEGGAQVFLSVPSMGMSLCPAKANIADASTLKVGDRIEARGQISADGSVIPCEYPGHYLRVVAR